MQELIWLGKKVDLVYVGIGEEEDCCVNCNYFHQHYVYLDENHRELRAVAWGHCSGTRRLKNRNAVDYCPMFEKRKWSR